MKRTSLKAEGGYAYSERWTDDHNRFVYDFNSSGISSAAHLTSYESRETIINGDFGGGHDGKTVDKYSFQKVFFQTENIDGMNVMMIKDGRYVQAGADGKPMTGDDGDRIAKVERNFNFSYKGALVTGADGNDYRVQDTVRLTFGRAHV